MALVCFPTEANVGAAADTQDARAYTEARAVDIAKTHCHSKVLSGFDKFGEVGLEFRFTPGVIVLNGYRIEGDDASHEAFTLPASTTGTIYLNLTRTTGLVTSAAFSVTAATDPLDGIPVRNFTTDGSSITADSDRRDLLGCLASGVSLAQATTLEIGFHPRTVHLSGIGTVDPNSPGANDAYGAVGYENRENNGGLVKWQQLANVTSIIPVTSLGMITWGAYTIAINAGLQGDSNTYNYMVTGY